MILSTTLLIVIITVIVNGGSTMSVLSWLGVPTGVLEDPGPFLILIVETWRLIFAFLQERTTP